MTWNNILDGQPGLALPAMQNWRHAGRFNGDMIPLDTDGVTSTAGTFKLGTANAPWSDLNLATGASIYIGGTAFEGGGGGSSIEPYELKSHFEKVGYDYPLSNPQAQNESFMDSAAMVFTLGKTHDLTDTVIYLDRDAYTISSLSLISATAWAVALTGTVATNTTAGQNVNGQSVKYAVTATNTSYLIKHSFTSFSMTDKNLKVWLYPDVVTNVTAALIRLYSADTTTGYAEWRIPVASITAATLNSLYLNIDSPDTTGAAYIRSSVNAVQLGLLGTATPQAIQWSWNFIRSVDNRPLKIPVQMVCDNGTNQEFININTATIAGDLYGLAATSTYTHTLSSTEIKLKQLDIANGQGVIASGTAGEAALTGWDIKRTYFDTTTSGDLVITSRWYDESYLVATVTNASTTVLSITTSTVKDGFKSGDVVRLYAWQYIDQNYQSPMNASIGSNFLDLTLTADGTATSSLLTLVHGNTSNQNLGGDTADKWRGVRVSADDYYRVEAATASQSLVKATPTIWLPMEDGIIYPSDVTIHWKLEQAGGSTQLDSKNNYYLLPIGAPTRVAGKFGYGASGFVSNTAYYRNYWLQLANEAGASTKYTVEAWVIFVNVSSGGYQTIFQNTDASYTNVSNALILRQNNSANLIFGTGAAAQTSKDTSSYVDGRWHYVVGIIDSSSTSGTRKWLYIDGVNVGTNENTADAFAAADGYVSIGATANANENWEGSIDDVCIHAGYAMTASEIQKRYALGYGKPYGYSPGYIQKSTIADVSGNKLITATRLTRQDATNQNPRIYQRDAGIT